jgi:hypothetical protein
MSTSSNRPLRWGVIGGVAALALIAVIIFLLHQKDSAVAVALDQLQPGMTDVEVEQVLKPVSHFKVATKQGTSDYTFYGLDGFVTVVMEKDGESSRVSKVIRQPDLGPWWERFRRKWESRLR